MNHAKLLFTAILSGNHGAASHLVLAGADPNFILPEGAAPIHVAAGLDSVPEDVVRLLLRHGADPNLRSSEGETPLHVSAAYGRCEVLKLFLLSGADPDILDQDGQSAADLARQSGCEVCMLTLREFVEAEAEIMEDDRTAFSLEPYEPCLLLPIRSFEQSPDESPEVTLRDRVDGFSAHSYTLNPEDGTCGSRETTASTLDSSSSFHTCPSDNDIPGQRKTQTEGQTISNQSSQANRPHSPEPNTAVKSPSRIPPVSHRTWTGRNHKETQNPEHARCSDKTTCDAPTNSAGCSQRSSRTQPPSKPESQGIELSDSSTLDYSPGRSLNAGGGSKSLSAAAAKANSNPNSPCGSKPAIDNTPFSKAKRMFKEKRDQLFDDTISSCSSAAFMPTEFDYSDLSLHMDPPVVWHDAGTSHDPYRQSLQKTSLPQVKGEEIKHDEGLKEVRTRSGHDLWYGQMHHYDNALSTTTDFCVDGENLPRTSSRNEPAICADLLENLSLSTIAESIADESDSKRMLPQWLNTYASTHPHQHTEKSAKFSTQYPAQPIENKESVALRGPCQRLLSNSGDWNKESVALRGPSQRLLSNSGDWNKESVALRGPCQRLLSNSGDGNKESVALRGPCQRLLLNSRDRNNSSKVRHWSLGSSSSRGSRNSSTSSVGPIHFLYTDDEDGYSLIESWYPSQDEDLKTVSPEPHPVSPLTLPVNTQPIGNHSTQPKYQESQDHTDDTILYDYEDTRPRKSKTKRAWSVDAEDSCVHHVDDNVGKLTDAGLRKALIAVGVTPGPINDDTRALYKQKLTRLQQNPGQPRLPAGTAYFPEMGRLLAGDLDTSSLQTLEDEMVKPFSDLDPGRKWREGTRKFSFNYLLLDPRITDNLPARVKTIGEVDAFRDFVKAIFYVGKGKRARPYAHFKEAIQQKTGSKNKPAGPKVQKILDVWSEGHGVVSLHVFQNVIPVEAYTREAAMIDAIGRPKLTNIKGGEYYGVAASWPAQQRRSLGARLLHKSFRIFLSEGERHIRPADIQGA